MRHNIDLDSKIPFFIQFLHDNEYAESTCVTYERAVRHFSQYLYKSFPESTEKNEFQKEMISQYKKDLQEHMKAESVNVMLSALNRFLDYCDCADLKVKKIKIQNKPFRESSKELSRNEYERLIAAAREKHNDRMVLLLQTICSSGIRVSEVCFITVEAAACGEVTIDNKGKYRTIILPGKLQKLLLDYSQKQSISTGPIFITRSGKPMDRSNIWKMMKLLCESAGVDPQKVYPHALRHLFARSFYQQEKDLCMLADLLGHSSIDTTRIYTRETFDEQRKHLDALNLV